MEIRVNCQIPIPGSKVGFSSKFSVLDMSIISSVGENLITWKDKKQDVFFGSCKYRQGLVNLVYINKDKPKSIR